MRASLRRAPNLSSWARKGWTEHVSLDADAQALAHLKRSLEQLNLAPLSLGGHPDVSTQGLDRALKALALCERLGIDILITAAGREGGEDSFFASIRQLADRAAAGNIQVAIEIAGEMASTGHLVALVLERIARDNVSINYDTANVEYYGGVRATDDLPGVVHRVGHVHLKDKRGGVGAWDFPAIGYGHVDFPAILRHLSERRFHRPDERRGGIPERPCASASPRCTRR